MAKTVTARYVSGKGGQPLIRMKVRGSHRRDSCGFLTCGPCLALRCHLLVAVEIKKCKKCKKQG